jgi:hypothetical protein
VLEKARFEAAACSPVMNLVPYSYLVSDMLTNGCQAVKHPLSRFHDPGESPKMSRTRSSLNVSTTGTSGDVHEFMNLRLFRGIDFQQLLDHLEQVVEFEGFGDEVALFVHLSVSPRGVGAVA